MPKFMCFLLIPQSWLTLCMLSVAICRGSLSQPSGVHRELVMRWECVWMRHAEHWRRCGPAVGEPQARHPQWLMRSLPTVCDVVTRIRVPLMISESPGCYSPCHSLLHHPPQLCKTQYSSSVHRILDFFSPSSVLELLCWIPRLPICE